MTHAFAGRLRRALPPLVLLTVTAGVILGLATWKRNALAAAAATTASQPEPAEVVEAATPRSRPFARTTTSIGTVRALQSITLRNELAGTVRHVPMATGAIVEAGALLVELDVAVEQAELAALEAEARLAASMQRRLEQALANQGASAADVDRARAEHDMALANVARTKALIERKRLCAPFRARVGMVDLHPGQYLEPGTAITTLQGVGEAVHIDFAVTQEAAAALRVGAQIDVGIGGGRTAPAKIVAVDARVEAATRNTWIRALLSGDAPLPQPGASVRVQVPLEAPRDVLVVPINALRRGPGGDHVFVLAETQDGAIRAQLRRVESGAAIGDEVIVEHGLTARERVAAAGSFKLREGALVHVAPTTPPAK
jgi:membrane fusion protein (multidrug efflux system)